MKYVFKFQDVDQNCYSVVARDYAEAIAQFSLYADLTWDGMPKESVAQSITREPHLLITDEVVNELKRIRKRRRNGH
jgi:hypothetical protein